MDKEDEITDTEVQALATEGNLLVLRFWCIPNIFRIRFGVLVKMVT